VAKQAPEARTLPDPTESPVVTAPDSAVVIGSGDAAQSSATGSGASPPADATASEPSTPPTPAAPPAQAPQSAILYYDVLGKDPKRDANQSYVGNGTLTWKLEGVDRYQADLKATASLLFLSFTVLESHSEGALDQGGLEPTRYSETPRNRAALVTLFRRGQDSVGVEPGTITPAQPGTQDRLSIVFQLGALLRGNPGFSEAGASFQVDVANLKGDSSPWTFRVLGLEPVNSGIGRIDAVHVQRVLRPGTNDRRIDVWIALDLGGYPARILYTEPSEAFVDLTLTKIE
jgi:hypothetical protein